MVSAEITEVLRRDYQITVAARPTMAALERFADGASAHWQSKKRSGEVWTILGAVKTEFEKFGVDLQQMQRHLNQTAPTWKADRPAQPRHHP